ncbi:MAG: ferredoxin family protein, partial [Verrucomicrobiia bacterium]
MSLLTAIISRSPSQDPRKRELEEQILDALTREPDVTTVTMPHLYDLAEADAVLRSATGPLLVLAWLYPRAIHWTLDRLGIKGQCGEMQLHRADSAEENPKGSASAPNVPARTIWSLDLRDGDDASL